MSHKTEAQWEAERDARTLAESKEIQSDSRRLGKAKRIAKTLAKEVQTDANNLKKVASGLKKVARVSAKRPAAKPRGKR